MSFESTTVLELIYWAATIMGGGLFLFRTFLLFAGGDIFSGDFDFDGDFDLGDIETDFEGDIHPDTDISFKFLSLQGITAFFMMFGLVGLAIFNSDSHPFFSIIGGITAGLFTTWVVGKVFTAMAQLESDGTTKIENAVGQIGEVYLSIPKNGSGQVSVIVQGGLKIFDAVSEDKNNIGTGESVQVVGIKGNTIVVKKDN